MVWPWLRCRRSGEVQRLTRQPQASTETGGDKSWAKAQSVPSVKIVTKSRDTVDFTALTAVYWCAVFAGITIMLRLVVTALDSNYGRWKRS